MSNQSLETTKRIGTGLAFILYPLFSGLAFAVHPNLLSLEFGRPVSDKVAEFHNNGLMHFGHFVMTLGVPLLIVIACKFMRMLQEDGHPLRLSQFAFGHGAHHRLPGGLRMFDSYHPSQQNTFTGRLTPRDLDRVLLAARRRIEAA